MRDLGFEDLFAVVVVFCFLVVVGLRLSKGASPSPSKNEAKKKTKSKKLSFFLLPFSPSAALLPCLRHVDAHDLDLAELLAVGEEPVVVGRESKEGRKESVREKERTKERRRRHFLGRVAASIRTRFRQPDPICMCPSPILCVWGKRRAPRWNARWRRRVFFSLFFSAKERESTLCCSGSLSFLLLSSLSPHISVSRPKRTRRRPAASASTAARRSRTWREGFGWGKRRRKKTNEGNE